MSGIYGQISLTKLTNNNNKILHLWNSMYGRSSEEEYSAETFFMGCCYDGDFDSTDTVSYPVIKASESVFAVIDAVIYNRESIFAALNEPNSSSVPDNKLLFSYIRKFGYDALRDVNGDFAGVVYDAEKKEVIMFRDHLGVRPLYYYAKNGLISFSTEIRGLLSSDNIPAELSENWLYRTISGLNPLTSFETEYEDIFCVVPAAYIALKLVPEISISEKKYWTLRNKKVRLNSEKEYFDTLRELITDAIKIRANRCPGKIGSELSGGLDSSVISIILNRLGVNATYYSWSPSPECLPLVKNDERLDIFEICKQENITCNYGSMKLRIHEDSDLYTETKRLLKDNFSGNKGTYDYLLPPFCNTIVISETMQFMREHGIKMVFTGHGGDEGVSHRCDPYEIYCNHEYLSFCKYMWEATKGKRNFTHHLAAFGRDTVKKIKSCKKNANIIKVNAISGIDIINTEFARNKADTPVNVFTFAYNPTKYILSGGVRPRFDNIAFYGAYSNIRYVAPYLDYRVIEYAVSIPRLLYLKGGYKRYIFRETFKDILPECIYNLRVKSTASLASIENETPDYSDILQKALQHIDEARWSKYLDFDKLRAFCQKDDNSEEAEELRKCTYQLLVTLNDADKILDSIKALKF